MPALQNPALLGRAAVLLATIFVLLGATAPAAVFDLKPSWDDRTPLSNPHKGWYHHFPDNHINKYRIGQDSDLLNFPGMDHLYIRLAWAYLEPQEGQFQWSVIDDLITKWTVHGLGISFRISCKETSTDRIEQQFATPRWVMEAGAQGGYYRMGRAAGPEAPWEPAFDDPVFLKKLEAFLKAFAERYDGKPWLRYVDIGSIGDWGEGHTWAGSRKEYGFEARKKHVDLHLSYFKKSLLVISDDFVHGTAGTREDRERMHRYVVEHGISYRDDSILVDGYFAGHSGTATVRNPEYFRDVYERMPTVLELEHYSAVKRSGNWIPRPGSSIAKHAPGKTGADLLRSALERLHATYIGYHGDAAEWLNDNPELTGELLNRCGYWYFPHALSIPERLQAGRTNIIEVSWENRGVAPAYDPFQILFRFEGSETVEVHLDAENRNWMPSEGKAQLKRYPVSLPSGMPSGTYNVLLKLRSPTANRDVQLALKPQIRTAEGYYLVGKVEVVGGSK
jgi:hypothetical protein